MSLSETHVKPGPNAFASPQYLQSHTTRDSEVQVQPANVQDELMDHTLEYLQPHTYPVREAQKRFSNAFKNPIDPASYSPSAYSEAPSLQQHTPSQNIYAKCVDQSFPSDLKPRASQLGNENPAIQGLSGVESKQKLKFRRSRDLKVSHKAEHETPRNEPLAQPILQTIQESTPTSKFKATQKVTRTPAPLDLKSAKAYGMKSSTNHQKPLHEEQSISKRTIFERLRGGPGFIHLSSKTAKKTGREQVTAAPRADVPEKAAQILGTAAKSSTKNFSRPTRLPSFGDLPVSGLKNTSEGLLMPKKGNCSGNGLTPTSARNFSPRMMKESSDPRLLLLNDRISSNMSPDNQDSAESTEGGPPPLPLKSPTQLRRVQKRIGNESETAPDSLRHPDTQNQFDKLFELSNVGKQKQPPKVGGGRNIASTSSWPLPYSENLRPHHSHGSPKSSSQPNNLYPSPLHIPCSRDDSARNKYHDIQADPACASVESIEVEGTLESHQCPSQRAESVSQHDTKDLSSYSRLLDKYLSGQDVGGKQLDDDATPAVQPSTPQHKPFQSFGTRFAKSTPSSIYANQSSVSASSRQSSSPETSLLKEILARLDVQKDNLFELKGHCAEGALVTQTEIAKLAGFMDNQGREINQLTLEVKTLQDLLHDLQRQLGGKTLSHSKSVSHQGKSEADARKDQDNRRRIALMVGSK